jgi:Fe-S cluster biogenesis protein NfuA/nitrite reductase/ring-hydroxylating ferredoxin subunit
MARIEGLLERLQTSGGDSELRAAAIEIARSLMELHGAGLRRMVEVIGSAGEPRARIMDSFVRDELIASLLLLYGLHPVDLETRVRRALDKVRPYLRSHGGDVELVALREGAVHVRLQGSCKSCPSSAMTLRLAVEEAIYESAPEVAEVVAEGSEQPADGRGPAIHSRGWEEVNGLADLADGALRPAEAGGRPLLLCRIGEIYYAYSAVCPACDSPLVGGRLEGGSLVCPACSRRYDLLLAGRSAGLPELQLEPFPLLVNDGRAAVALAQPNET